MTLDEIRNTLAQYCSDLVVVERKDGLSFYLDPPQKGIRSNRIIRVSRSSPNAVTRLKLAVSSRLGDEVEIEFTGDESALRERVQQEMRLFEKHFAT